MLVSHVLVPPAMEAILSSPEQPRAGLPGRRPRLHGHGLRGVRADRRAATTCPIVVTGFEPLDILQGMLHVRARSSKRAAPRSRTSTRAPCAATATAPAQQLMRRGLPTSCDRKWRGIGEIPASGLGLRRRVRATSTPSGASASATSRREEPAECISGLVLQGQKKPHECPAFGTRCTPEQPLGAHHGLHRRRLRRVLPLPPRRLADAGRDSR